MKRNKIKYILCTLFLLALVCLVYAYYEARNIQIVRHVYANDNIPQGFVGKKIIFVSDIHVNRFFDGDDLANLVTRINNCKPYIIFLGGDYTEIDTLYSKPFFDELKNLESTHGTYFVLGNHDHWGNAEMIRNRLLDCGFYDCSNLSYWIKQGEDSIKIGGVGDLWEDEQIIANTINDIGVDNFCILLSHNPDYIEIVKEKEASKIDLMLSGHTHAGQITLFGLWAPIMPVFMRNDEIQTGQKYRYGWKQIHNINLYISSGIGMGGIPFRFFAPPEIVEIVLEKQSL